MKRIAVLSFGSNLKKLIHYFENYTEEPTVKYFITDDYRKVNGSNSEEKLITLWDFIRYYKENNIDMIIIPEIFQPYIITKVVDILKSEKISEIYIYPIKELNNHDSKNKDIEEVIIKYDDFSYLPYLEFHVCDHCNLNCNGCTHFSPLVKNKTYTDFGQFKKDINRLAELFDSIYVIRILGGEPLLNSDLYKFIEEVKRTFPFSLVYVVTNGLLIKNMDDKIINTFKKYKITLDISCYKVIWEQIDDIRNYLDSIGIRFIIEEPITSFFKFLNLKQNSNKEMIYERCPNKTCKILYDGKISTCAMTFYIKYFNEYFNKNIISDPNDFVDIYDENITWKELKKRINSPIKMCENCSIPEKINWSNSSNIKKIDDWVVDW